MAKITHSFVTEDIFAKDSIYILFGKCSGVSGVITGMFEIDHLDLYIKESLDLYIRENQNGSLTVSPRCFVENNDYEFESVDILVPMHGLVIVLNYTGPVIREIKL